MNTMPEIKIDISNARITDAKATIMPDGTCKLNLNIELIKPEVILVEASKLSLSDDFMGYEPQTEWEKNFKDILTEVIKNGIEDFYRPVMDPSFTDETNTKIHYMAGEKPAIGKSYNWWKETVKDSKWCFGTKSQYVAFLGVLIKKLVIEGWSIKEAWNAVCNDSKELGKYRRSSYEPNAKFDDTGSKEICGFFDLANTYKILATDKESGCFWLAGGFYETYGDEYPLVHLSLSDDGIDSRDFGVPWLVLRK